MSVFQIFEVYTMVFSVSSKNETGMTFEFHTLRTAGPLGDSAAAAGIETLFP